MDTTKQFTLYLQKPKPKKVGVGVLSIGREGDCHFFEGLGDSYNSSILAVMHRVKIDFAAANGIMLSGMEYKGFDKKGNQKYNYQEWWLIYSLD